MKADEQKSKRSQKLQPKQINQSQKINRPESSADNRDNRFSTLALSEHQPQKKRKKSVHFPKDPVVMIEDIQQLDQEDSFVKNEFQTA